MFIPKQKRYQLYIYYSWYQKICVYLYRNKNKITINIQFFSQKKTMRAFQSEKQYEKRPQNTLARRVVRRKEEEKEKRNLLAAMVRRFFHLRRRIV